MVDNHIVTKPNRLEDKSNLFLIQITDMIACVNIFRLPIRQNYMINNRNTEFSIDSYEPTETHIGMPSEQALKKSTSSIARTCTPSLNPHFL